MIDERKFCFIICSNNDDYLEECFFYINQLEIPEGYSIDAISIFEADSMTSGYNEAMRATNAKYKIYLHQDVFIIYKGFLRAILDIFQSDSSIGMIGMVGASKMPAGGVMWLGKREGMLYGTSDVKGEYGTYRYCIEDGLHEVEAIDGLLMVTCLDMPWREDKFDGWDFYDVSQSFEFRKNGLKVVVPEQLCPWCKHDDGALNLVNYDKYRKICMEEYPEYFVRERFCVVKNSADSCNKRLCVAIIARNQVDAVKSTVESIKAFSSIDVSQIIIVDNGSEDGLRHWLHAQQEMDYIICEEVMEGYGAILNAVVKQFIKKEDLLILTPGVMVLPGGVDALCNGLEEAQTGAVCARLIEKGTKEGKRFSDAAQYAMAHANIKEKREVLGMPYEALLISYDMLQKLEAFDERLLLPGSAMVDFAFRGVRCGYHFYEIQNAFMYKLLNSENEYFYVFKRNVDRPILKEKWEMNYFNEHPNYTLLACVDKGLQDSFNVLEVGCDCGVNLLHLKNMYPNANLYGVEINSSAVAIASHIAQVKLANIEDKNLDFEGIKFDYIMFGDVLEHLRDPEGTIRYCQQLLKEDGRIIACIPNLMHYTVMRDLLDGNFTYTDTGLLDKTHVHFFTYNEILKMFEAAGYKIDRITYTGGEDRATKEDKEFVDKLLSLSNKTDRFMFYVIQYVVSAAKNN